MREWTPEEQLIIASMPPACRKAWDAFAADDVGSSMPLLFVTAFNAGVQSYGARNTERAKDKPLEEILAGAPEHCTRPLKTIPRNGTVIWIERRARDPGHGKPLKYRVVKAYWRKHDGPTGGYWLLQGIKSSGSTSDELVIGWEPVA